MKYLVKCSIILSVLLLVNSSCSESFLDLKDPSSLSYDNFYKTTQDFQASLTGAYASLGNNITNILAINELTSDNTYTHNANTDDRVFLDNCVFSSSTGIFENFWWNCYRTITISNMVISRIDKSEVPDATKKVFLAEAKFLRGLAYFNLVRVFGGVPKYDKEETNIDVIYHTPRSSVDEIYNLIISDFTAAKDLDTYRAAINDTKVAAKATSLAAKAFLGKVYLQKHDYANAAITLGDIIQSSGLQLEPDLKKLYDFNVKYNEEIIFVYNYERVSGQNSPLTFQFIPRSSYGLFPYVTRPFYGDGGYNVEPVIAAKFEAGDDRRTLLIDTLTSVFAGTATLTYFSKKYLDVNTNVDELSAAYFIFMRYADVLLLYADALNNTGKTADAYKYIDMVRERAGLGKLPTGYTKEQMNDALANERQFEFLCEGDRWFDLSYRGFDYLKSTLNNFWPSSHQGKKNIILDRMVVFPIPYDEVAMKPGVLKQNDGY